MLLLLLAACGGSPAEDVERYAALVAQRSPDPARDMDACAELDDVNLAGDCALVIAQRAATARKVAPGTWCDDVPSGVWRDECWFQAAEIERRRGREQEAATQCQKSGPFINDCAQHLWQTRVHGLIHSDGGAPDFAGKLDKALLIYKEWAPLLSADTDMESRFWTKYYQNGFEGAGRVSLSWCDPLPEEHRARCVAAAGELVVREIAPNLDRANAWTAFCALSPATSENTGAWLRLDPSPELDRIVAERQTKLCRR